MAGARRRRVLPAETEQAARALAARPDILDILFPPSRRASLFDSDVHRVWKRARDGARLRGLEFDFPLDEARALYESTDGRCAVSGIAFDRTHRVPGSSRRPFLPSLDRIDCARGYVRGNVRFVCCIVNIALGDWGEETLQRVALGIALKLR